MATKKILLRPGVNTQLSQTLNEGGISGSNLMRFREGLPEKLGGWANMNTQHVIGTVRSLHAWMDLSNIIYLAFGSEQRLQLLSAGAITDITPIRRTANLTNALSTTAGSNVVTVADVLHGASVTDNIVFPIPVAIGGLVLFGNYVVASVPDANHYTFLAAANATATVAAGGATPAFTTTNGSNVVNVLLPNHGLSSGSVFRVQSSTTVGGVTLANQYIVNTVIDANNFTILASSAATSSATVSENGGQAQIQYLLPTGLASDQPVVGWGGGAYGMGVYGTANVSSLVINPLRNWSLGNFGQNLVAVPTNGALYAWIPPVAAGNVAAVVSAAPSISWAMFVAMPQQQVVLLGSSTAGVQDPLLVRFSDVGDYTVWTASATNQAGSYRLPRGSKIVGGLQGPTMGFIWTDVEVWGMQYTQPPFVYSFMALGSGCGLIAPKAACVMASAVYWMSQRGFFSYGGNGVAPVKCDVWDAIFKNLDPNNLSKILAAPNSAFNEVGFFYPSLSGGGGEIDSYAKFNVAEGLWDYGSLVRTAWTDQSILGMPVGVDGPNGLIQQHEIAVDANGAPMTGVEITTGFFDLEDGEYFIFVDQIIPDFVWTGSSNAGAQTLQLTVYVTNYPGDPPTAFGPYTITSSTEYITLNTRARQMAFKIESDGLGVFWRLGAMRYRGAPDGKQ